MKDAQMQGKLSKRAFSWGVALFCVAVGIASCGGSTAIYDQFTPTRFVVFGDALSMSTGSHYTVNASGATDNWTVQVANSFGIGSIASANAAGAGTTLSTLSNQISTFGTAYQASDMVLISGGYWDVINLAQTSGSVASATALGQQYANLIRSVVANGAKHVGAVNLHDFSVSYASNGGAMSQAGMKALIRAFNDGLKTNLGTMSGGVSVGDYVRLVDSEAYFNLVLGNPSVYGFTDATTVVCSSATPVVSSSIGFGSVDSSTCAAPSTNLNAAYSTSYNSYVYADPVYWTPAMHRSFGSNAYALLRARW